MANPSQVRRGGLNFRRERPEVSITPSYVRGLYLNDRDRAVVRFLSEIGYATTDQLRRMFWPDNAPQTASGRLLDLWEMWVLDRQPFYQLPDYGVAPQLVYMLGRAGVKMLQDLDENVTRRDGTLLMGHNVMLGEAVVRLVETARALGDGHDVSFLGEAAAYTAFKWEGQWARMRPDGLIYLEVDGKELPFYVEFDRGTRPLDHVIGKVKQYDLYRRSKDWKRERRVFPGIMVVVWTRYPCDRLSAEAAAERRRAKAQRRLDGVIERLQKMTRQSGLRWFCQRLDLVGKKPWRVVTADGLKQAPAFFTRNGHKRG